MGLASSRHHFLSELLQFVWLVGLNAVFYSCATLDKSGSVRTPAQAPESCAKLFSDFEFGFRDEAQELRQQISRLPEEIQKLTRESPQITEVLKDVA